MDFTLSEYGRLLRFLLDTRDVYTVAGYLESRPRAGFVILRHDVDRSPMNALKMAELESEVGVRSTYYFRYPGTFKPRIIRRIWELGHEVGYHYETLSKTGGDYERAIAMFEHELGEFRKIVDVKTVCMHGSPLSKFDNRALWERYDFRDYGLVGEAYLSIDDPEMYYVTDTGRNWENRNNVRDRSNWRSLGARIRSTGELIEVLRDVDPQKLYMTVHPERWGYGVVNWGVAYLRDALFNLGKRVVRLYGR